MLQNATCLRKSAPGPPNSSDEHVSCIAPATEKCIFADPLQMSHACHRFWTCHQTLTFCLLLTRCTINPLRLPRKTTSERPKVLRTSQFFTLLTSKCASRHNAVHFFDISTSEREVFSFFTFANVLRATVCISSTSQLPKVLRT